MSEYKNRYGDVIKFKDNGKGTIEVTGGSYCSCSGWEGESTLDFSNLQSVDPSGGPYMSVGQTIEGRVITRISIESIEGKEDEDSVIMLHYEC